MLKLLSVLLLFLAFSHFGDRTEAAECRDKVERCDHAKPYCGWSSLRKTLSENCEKTCGFCRSSSSSSHKKSKPKRHPSKPKSKPRKKRAHGRHHPPAPSYPHYKLHYFNFRFRGEPARLIFRYKKVPFEDFRIDPAEWPKLKPNYPNGQVPALEINGKILMESGAIYRYLGRRFGLFGKDLLESAFLDATAELHRELVDATGGFIRAKLKLTPGDPDKLYTEEFLPALTKYLPQLVQKLKDSKSGFFGKSGVSWVDFYVSESTQTFDGFAHQEVAKYPEILEHMQRVQNLPQIRAYVKNRPKTPL
ncbi:GST protein [Aphelenchoides fujianensis]|nr:GST protein [Aphelenchoides fujianensis]